MKKFLKFLLVVTILGLTTALTLYFLDKDNTKKNGEDYSTEVPIVDFDVELVGANVTKYYIYGRNLNIIGNLNNEFTEEIKNIELLIAGREKKIYEIEYDTEEDLIYFNISNLKNGGILLDDFDKGEYYFFLKITFEPSNDVVDENNKDSDTILEEETVKYIKLLDDSDYSETIYYTISNINNKIVMNFNNEHNTLWMNITENKDSEIYDITIDAGHGGKDGGATYNGYKETDFTLDIAKLIKGNLENYGLKVKLTRDENTLGPNDKMEEYGKGGRAVIAKESNSKYSISIHLNSSPSKGLRGVEIYSATNIDYSLAKNIVSNIVSYTGTTYSNNTGYKIYNGIYSRNFSNYDIKISKEEASEKGIEPYNITTNTTYYYMIRESGCLVTGAYVDGRDPEVGGNEFYKSNVGVEGYNLEVGYIISSIDVENIKNKKDLYAKAVADALLEHLNINIYDSDSISE